MSRFLRPERQNLVPYVPGEQPEGMERMLKLNTNENPYPPTERAWAEARTLLRSPQLYSDPEARALRAALGAQYGVPPEWVLPTNGSDEGLDFCFQAYCGPGCPALFPDITYGFYPVFAQVNQVPFCTVPLRADWTVCPRDYEGLKGTVFLANPNAPTGMALPREQVAALAAQDADRVVVVDEAYVDFGAQSAVPLLQSLPNLVITGTFSKSRSLAGGRLGFVIAREALIADLNRIRTSRNPYNVSSFAQAMGLAILRDQPAVDARCQAIARTREDTAQALRTLGFEVLPSQANFVFARHPAMPGDALAAALRQHNILVRHFTLERIRDWNRITIGTPEQMRHLLDTVRDILKETAP